MAQPVSGFTHLKQTDTVTEWSGYRFHDMDPVRFHDGVKVNWRCGDQEEDAPNGGNKCYSEAADKPVGKPRCDWVDSYGWVYVWPNGNNNNADNSTRAAAAAETAPVLSPESPESSASANIAKGCWFEEGGTEPCWGAAGQHGQANDTALTFGTGLSGGGFSPTEKTLFAHKIAPGHTGLMNHFWSTCNAECEGALLVRYYIDGEATASIAYEPGMAAGTGFDDTAAPWGTKWIGHGAHSAWFNNFKIPFGSSVRVTIQSTDGKAHDGFYMIVRGGLDLPLRIGDVTLPATARLQLQRFAGPMKTNEVRDIVSVPAGHEGTVFLTALSVNNSGLGDGFLEGCPHFFDPPDQVKSGHQPGCSACNT
jgi:hypothetical protein